MIYIKSILLIVLQLLLISCGGGAGSDVKPPESTKCTVELNGDSIMSGIGIDTFAISISKLRPNYIIVDKALTGLSLGSMYSGYTAPYAGAPVPPFGPQPQYKDVIRTSKVILIELGGNDAYGLIDPNIFRNQLEEIIKIILNEGRIPVLTGIVPLAYDPNGIFNQAVLDRATELDTIVHELAIKYSILDAHWRTVEFNGLSDTIDSIHWKQIPANRLINRTIETIDKACLK